MANRNSRRVLLEYVFLLLNLPLLLEMIVKSIYDDVEPVKYPKSKRHYCQSMRSFLTCILCDKRMDSKSSLSNSVVSCFSCIKRSLVKMYVMTNAGNTKTTEIAHAAAFLAWGLPASFRFFCSKPVDVFDSISENQAKCLFRLSIKR